MALQLKEITPGMYVAVDGSIAKVQKSKRSSHLYAKLLNSVTNKFEYSNGLIFNLKERLSLEEAKAYGKRTGICCVCGLTLTNEISVREGIGPICGGRL